MGIRLHGHVTDDTTYVSLKGQVVTPCL